MDARQLKFFLAVVDHGSVTRASESLFVAQPSVSQTIRRLEHDMGAKLFDRSGRSLVLTAAGEALVEPARQIQSDLHQAVQAIQKLNNLEYGRLDIVVAAGLAIDPLSEFIASFRKNYPGVWLNILEARSSEEISHAIRNGSCELALWGATEQPLHGLSKQVLGQRTLPLILPPGTEPEHPFVLPDIETVPLIAAPRGELTRELVEQACNLENVTPDIRVEVELISYHADLVVSGLGAAFIAPEVAHDAVKRGAVLADMTPPIKQTLYFLYHKDTVSAAAQVFIEMAKIAYANNDGF